MRIDKTFKRLNFFGKSFFFHILSEGPSSASIFGNKLPTDIMNFIYNILEVTSLLFDAHQDVGQNVHTATHRVEVDHRDQDSSQS